MASPTAVASLEGHSDPWQPTDIVTPRSTFDAPYLHTVVKRKIVYNNIALLTVLIEGNFGYPIRN